MPTSISFHRQCKVSTSALFLTIRHQNKFFRFDNNIIQDWSSNPRERQFYILPTFPSKPIKLKKCWSLGCTWTHPVISCIIFQNAMKSTEFSISVQSSFKMAIADENYSNKKVLPRYRKRFTACCAAVLTLLSGGGGISLSWIWREGTPMFWPL